jgi:hypothetical protein
MPGEKVCTTDDVSQSPCLRRGHYQLNLLESGFRFPGQSLEIGSGKSLIRQQIRTIQKRRKFNGSLQIWMSAVRDPLVET